MSIKRIDIVHHIHTDLGYTDYPQRARELQADFVGQAVEAVLAGGEEAPFAWTCEALLSVDEWLQKASAEQQTRFYAAVETGRLEVTALPFNVTPFHSEEEWDKMLSWMPPSFRERVPICTAMQNDINGFPAAAAEKLLDRGVRYLWMGPNRHLAAPPFQTPHAFRWRLPSGRELFVWLNGHYNNGFYLFNEFWREGPIPGADDTRYRRPDAADIFRTDDASMARAYRQCSKCIAAFEGREPNAGQFVRDGFVFNKIEGVYPYETLAVSITNHWRMDNDPPILHLNRFVQRWNALGYQPELRMVTAGQAMREIEREAGAQADVAEGEWPDWWANGTMSLPRELSYAREAARTYRSAIHPALGGLTAEDSRRADRALRELCVFNEHTYGSWQNIADPNGFDAVASIAEVSIHAYRALVQTRALLADRFRRAFPVEQNDICVFHPGAAPYDGWIRLPRNCLRGNYRSVKDLRTGAVISLEQIRGSGDYSRPASMEEMSDEFETTDYADARPNRDVRFWVNRLPAGEVSRFRPCNDAPDGDAAGPALLESVVCDRNGWPSRILYRGYEEPLLQPGFADFTAVSVDCLAPRWAMMDIFDEPDDAARQVRRADLRQSAVSYGETICTESAYELRYEQPFFCASLGWAKRILTVSRYAPQAGLELRLRRRDRPQPELYYLQMNVSDTREPPVLSLANHEFVPGQGQIPNTCMDYYASDGWIRYTKGDICWLVDSADAPMLTLGEPNCFARLRTLPAATEKPLFLLFDNTWDTNFAANQTGRLLYRFTVRQARGSLLRGGGVPAEPLPVLVRMRNQTGEGGAT